MDWRHLLPERALLHSIKLPTWRWWKKLGMKSWVMTRASVSLLFHSKQIKLPALNFLGMIPGWSLKCTEIRSSWHHNAPRLRSWTRLYHPFLSALARPPPPWAPLVRSRPTRHPLEQFLHHPRWKETGQDWAREQRMNLEKPKKWWTHLTTLRSTKCSTYWILRSLPWRDISTTVANLLQQLTLMDLLISCLVMSQFFFYSWRSDHLELQVVKFLAAGAFAQVYQVENVGTWAWNSSTSALKVQSPPCPWEFYICRQLQKRIPADMVDLCISILISHRWKSSQKWIQSMFSRTKAFY